MTNIISSIHDGLSSQWEHIKLLVQTQDYHGPGEEHFDRFSPEKVKLAPRYAQFFYQQEELTREICGHMGIAPAESVHPELLPSTPLSMKVKSFALKNLKHSAAGFGETGYHIFYAAELSVFLLADSYDLIECCLRRIFQGPRLIAANQFNHVVEKLKDDGGELLLHITQTARSALRATPLIGPYLGFTFDVIHLGSADMAHSLINRIQGIDY